MNVSVLEESKEAAEPSVPCTVLAVYEDTPTREALLDLCAGLRRPFEEELDFEFSWWKFKHLADSQIATQAVDAAVKADLILFSIHASGDLPPEIKRWIDRWTAERKGREGVLAVLLEKMHPRAMQPSYLDYYFRAVAEQAGLDYISQLESERITESFESIFQRSRQITPVLDQILHRPLPYRHWGLNE